MALFYDVLDYKRDNFEVIPRYEWRILGKARAKVPIPFTKFCAPNCEAYQEDFDKKPICQYGCTDFIFDRHLIDTNDEMLNLLFAVNTLDVHSGVSIWIGEKYLRKLMGDSTVEKMLKEYADLEVPAPPIDLEEFDEEVTNEIQKPTSD